MEKADEPNSNAFNSLSTWLLIFSGALALAALLNIIPWNIIFIDASAHEKLSFSAWARIGLALGSPIWIMAFYRITVALQSRRMDVILKISRPVTPEEFSPDYSYSRLRSQLPVWSKVEIRVSASDGAIDDSGETLNSPKAVSFGKPRRFIIFFTALFRQRFSKHPQAFEAVLAHELAHFQNKDLEWLEGMKRLLVAVIAIITIAWMMDMYLSVVADIKDGWDWQALQASLAGKNFILTGIVLIVALFAYVRWITDWREALADRTAITICGQAALQSAEALIQGNSGDSMRPSPLQRQQALSLTWRETLLLGLTVNVISEYGAGPFAYLGRILLKDLPSGQYLEPLSAALLELLGYFGFFAILRIIALDVGQDGPRRLAISANILMIGSVIGHMLLEVLPLLVTSVAMPDGYDNVYLHDPVALVLGGLINETLTLSFMVLLAAMSAFISISRQHLWMGIAPGVVWVLMTTLESTVFPELAEGWLAVGVISILMLALYWPKLSTNDFRHTPTLIWLPIVSLSFLYWSGYGDVNHLAACSSQAAVRMADKGDLAGAISAFRRAANRAPMVADGWMQLAAILSKQPDNIDAAIDAAEHAVATPFTSAWETRFESNILAGNLRLLRRRPGDVGVDAEFGI